ncbi:MAG: hypothetical protein AB2693_15785 [Candidatus Thiodiazotropha sp.]
MANDQDLTKVEESLKQQFLDVVKKMSHLELKKFNKYDYKKKVLKEMSKLLPDHEKSQLSDTAHYISNALNNEAQTQLRKKSRDCSPSKTNELSNTVLEELDTTMQPSQSENDKTSDDEEDLPDYEVNDSLTDLDDSITQQKQIPSSESETATELKMTQTNSNTANEQSICCKS